MGGRRIYHSRVRCNSTVRRVSCAERWQSAESLREEGYRGVGGGFRLRWRIRADVALPTALLALVGEGFGSSCG